MTPVNEVGSAAAWGETTYEYDAANKLLSETKNTGLTAEMTNYTYDANGNMLSDVVMNATGGIASSGEYTYNGFNQLVMHTDTDGVKTSYTYDASGLRVSKDGTAYVWDAGNIVAEVEDGETTATYLRGMNLILSDAAVSKSYYLYNAHGDVVQLTNASGTVTKTYDYDAFGKETDPDDADENPFRYCGEYYDTESETYYLRARNYDPSTGRFTQQDSVRGMTIEMLNGQEIIDPLSLNLYTYCYNSPIYYLDPSGHVIELSSKATEEQIKQYQRAIEYLMTSKTGKALIGKLQNSETVFTIMFISNDRDQFLEGVNRIKWNPSRGLVLGDGESVCSPAVALAHEMGHAAQYLDGFLDGFPETESVEADNLEKYEIPISKELGEFTRKDYYDASGMVTVNSSTDWGTITTVIEYYKLFGVFEWKKLV